MESASNDIGRKPASGEFEQVPILDLGPLRAGSADALESLGRQLRDALENVGFYYIKNHGVAQDLIDRIFGEARRVHALSLEEKMKIKVNRSSNGYLPMKATSDHHSKMDKAPAPNENESYFCRRERDPEDPDVKAGKDLRDPNQWPDLPGFKETMLEYLAAMENLGLQMLPVVATALGLPKDYFNPFFETGEVTNRLIHYPPGNPDAATEGVFGHGAHTDRNFMTFLAQANVPGLEILTTSGDWYLAPLVPGTFLVNAGDTLRRWSNEQFRSTAHRVLNRSGTDRYSVVFFYGPNLNSIIECPPACTSSERPVAHPPIKYEDFRREFINVYFHHRQEITEAEVLKDPTT